MQPVAKDLSESEGAVVFFKLYFLNAYNFVRILPRFLKYLLQYSINHDQKDFLLGLKLKRNEKSQFGTKTNM